MWALVENNVVIELTDVDPEGRYHPDMPWVKSSDTVKLGFIYTGSSFVAPPSPSEAELVGAALGLRDRLLGVSALRIAPLQDAVDLGLASEEEKAALLEWKRYRVSLNRIQEQPAFPGEVNWPDPPEGGTE